LKYSIPFITMAGANQWARKQTLVSVIRIILNWTIYQIRQCGNEVSVW